MSALAELCLSPRLAGCLSCPSASEAALAPAVGFVLQLCVIDRLIDTVFPSSLQPTDMDKGESSGVGTWEGQDKGEWL